MIVELVEVLGLLTGAVTRLSRLNDRHHEDCCCDTCLAAYSAIVAHDLVQRAIDDEVQERKKGAVNHEKTIHNS